MPTFNGSKLPDSAKLSDYLDNQNEAVRLIGLRLGQTIEIDVSLDGGYLHPDQPPQFGWVSPVTGLGGVHTALLAITKSTGFALHATNKSEIRNSRGRGVSISECDGFVAEDLWVRGARTAGIALSKCSVFQLDRPVTIDTGNYQSAKGQGKNYPGSLKLEHCRDYRMIEPASIDHMGNGQTPSDCANGEWLAPFTFGVNGAQVYINASPNHTVVGGLVVGRAASYVVQSEEENDGPSENVRFERCYALDSEWGLGFWGNEKKPGIIIQNAAFVDGVLISDRGMKIHPNAKVLDFDDAGTILLKPTDLPANVLANLRSLSDRLAAAYRDHADAADITAARVALGAAFAALRGPVVEPEPAIDRAALLAWFEEGEALRVQMWDWHARGWAIARGE
jgi:hypothetical protein